MSPRLAKAALAAVDDQVVDLSYPLTQDVRVQILTADGPDALKVYRHSTATCSRRPSRSCSRAQCGIGPVIEEPPGFYYDFVVERPFVPEDLEKIEAEMRRWRRPTRSSSRCGRATRRSRSSAGAASR